MCVEEKDGNRGDERDSTGKEGGKRFLSSEYLISFCRKVGRVAVGRTRVEN